MLDFKKAFDNKVPHSLLMQKVGQIKGIHLHNNNNIVNWLQQQQGFFTDRTQRVAQRGRYTVNRSIISYLRSAIRLSTCPPPSFHPLPKAVTCKVSLYADDNLMRSAVSCEKDVAPVKSKITIQEVNEPENALQHR